MPRAAIALAIVASSASLARADEDFGKGTIIFARGKGLYRVDAKGRGETELATFATAGPVRALRTDAAGKILLADINGAWGWMPLDGSTKTLTSLACQPGPAQLADDGSAVACKSDKAGTPTMVIVLATKLAFYLDVPLAGARPLDAKRIVFADKTGIYIAPINDVPKKQQVAPEAPLRAFLPSPDGTRAVGVYAGEVYKDVRTKKPAEVLMNLQLDGIGARRRAIKDAVPIEWSHDAMWILVQDSAQACLMGAHGGEYKCWPGYTAMSTSPDGKWTLVLGNRDGSAKKAPAAPPKGKAPPAPVKSPDDDSDEDDAPAPEVAVALPSGPQSLYRARLEGMFTEKPVVIAKIVDGAAVWVPAPPAP